VELSAKATHPISNPLPWMLFGYVSEQVGIGSLIVRPISIIIIAGILLKSSGKPAAGSSAPIRDFI
jgi:hypothetical protein